MILNKREIECWVKDGFITCQKHPTRNLYIYNYTDKCTHYLFSNSLICLCRGLVLDKDGYVMVRPIKKIFTMDQRKTPLTDYEITIQSDGFPVNITRLENGELSISGHSFEDEYLEEVGKYLKCIDSSVFQRKYTYAFDYVSPNFIRKIKYNVPKLILLSVIKNKNGKECPLIGLRTCKFPFYIKPFTLFKNIKKLNEFDLNERGFVLKDLYDNSRYKIELKSYIDKIFLNTKSKEEEYARIAEIGCST